MCHSQSEGPELTCAKRIEKFCPHLRRICLQHGLCSVHNTVEGERYRLFLPHGIIRAIISKYSNCSGSQTGNKAYALPNMSAAIADVRCKCTDFLNNSKTFSHFFAGFKNCVHLKKLKKSSAIQYGDAQHYGPPARESV